MAPRRDYSRSGYESEVPDIEPDELELEPGEPEVEDVRTEYLGTVGDRTLELVRVWVIVGEETPEESVRTAKAKAIQKQIRAILADSNPEWVPSIRFRTATEYEEDTGESL